MLIPIFMNSWFVEEARTKSANYAGHLMAYELLTTTEDGDELRNGCKTLSKYFTACLGLTFRDLQPSVALAFEQAALGSDGKTEGVKNDKKDKKGDGKKDKKEDSKKDKKEEGKKDGKKDKKNSVGGQAKADSIPIAVSASVSVVQIELCFWVE